MRPRNLVSLIALLCVPVATHATYNAAATGQVLAIQQNGAGMGSTPGNFSFTLNTQPSVTCSSGYPRFSVSSSTIADAETRRNIYALVMAAKAGGSTITVGYDNLGGFCDNGMLGVHWVSAQ